MKSCFPCFLIACIYSLGGRCSSRFLVCPAGPSDGASIQPDQPNQYANNMPLCSIKQSIHVYILNKYLINLNASLLDMMQVYICIVKYMLLHLVP